MAKDREQKKTFVIYEDMMNIVLSLPDDAALDFARALFSYYLDKDFDASAVSAGLLETYKARIDADIAEYKAKCQKNKDNIAAYWERKRTEADEYERIRTNTNVLQTNSKRIHDNDNDNDNEYEKKKKMCSNEHIKEIADEWNATFANTDVPKVTILKPGSKRAKMLQARLDEFGKEKVIDAMKTAAESSFLTSSSWFSFDWFCCPSNFVKIIEGNYKDHAQQLQAFSPAPKRGSAAELQNFYDAAAKWAEGG